MKQTTVPSGRFAFDRKAFAEGLRDGVPIGLGYFAVSVSLGIAARHAGMTPLQGLVASWTTTASAGEHAVFTSMIAQATYLEIAIITLIANARYLLMSCALSQRMAVDMPFWHRFIIGFHVTDEIFGVTIARPGHLVPSYSYGTMCTAVPPWAIGTAVGIMLGNALPARIVSALSVALYGMFLAIIIPPSRKSRIVAGLVIASFALSFIAGRLPVISSLSGGTRTIILTVLLSAAAAILFPVHDDQTEGGEAA